MTLNLSFTVHTFSLSQKLCLTFRAVCFWIEIILQKMLDICMANILLSYIFLPGIVLVAIFFVIPSLPLIEKNNILTAGQWVAVCQREIRGKETVGGQSNQPTFVYPKSTKNKLQISFLKGFIKLQWRH